LDRPRRERAARRGERSESIPLTAIFLVRKYGLFQRPETTGAPVRRASEASQSPSPPYSR
jgi:hypothetical protein